MKLGTDFVWIARLVIWLLKAILDFANSQNEEGNGEKIGD
jgi:hypothetical protein